MEKNIPALRHGATVGEKKNAISKHHEWKRRGIVGRKMCAGLRFKLHFEDTNLTNSASLWSLH